MIPSCESYNCQCERCENWHKDCCDVHKIECPQMGKLQEPCDGFKPKNKPEQRQILFEVRLTAKYDSTFMYDRPHVFVWANSAEEAVKALDNAIGGGKSQKLYTIEAKPVIAFGTEVTRDANERKEED